MEVVGKFLVARSKGSGGWGETVKDTRSLLAGDESVLKLNRGAWLALSVLNSTGFFTLRWLIFCEMNFQKNSNKKGRERYTQKAE